MLRFTPVAPELKRLFLTRSLRYYMLPKHNRKLEPAEFIAEIEERLGISGLSYDGEGDPDAYLGTLTEPEIHPLYWNH
ncbi:hypothetical protein [Breoghania sp.]|uniref:hypothetical protein n=1 Tax=Breoghania sp. TaxID=2065378 RepID=UPI0029C9BCC9|nr:hypothetical protein [Breoghania sp.]